MVTKFVFGMMLAAQHGKYIKCTLKKIIKISNWYICFIYFKNIPKIIELYLKKATLKRIQ